MSNNSSGTVAFHVPKTSSLYANPDLYGKIGQAGRILTYEHVLPPRSGHAFEVPAGSIFRILTPEGPQVGDLNIWNLHDPRERMWTARSRQLYEAHLTVGDRLVSNLPYIRPLATIVGDSLQHIRNNGSWGVHDILGTRCDPYVNVLLGGDSFDYHCHSNLVRSVIPFGLTEHDVHDNINLFQITDINENGQYRLHPCPAKAGDYIEFFAEIDLLVALSACSGGDLTEFGWMTTEMKEAAGSDDKMQNTCRPLKVEVYQITDQQVLAGWSSPQRADKLYRGLHGVQVPIKSISTVKEGTLQAVSHPGSVLTVELLIDRGTDVSALDDGSALEATESRGYGSLV